MFHAFQRLILAIIIASWPLIEAWSVERGPAPMDTSEICSLEALVGRSYHRPKFRILSAKRGTQTRLPCSSLLFTYLYILMPLSGASARARRLLAAASATAAGAARADGARAAHQLDLRRRLAHAQRMHEFARRLVPAEPRAVGEQPVATRSTRRRPTWARS